MAGNTIGKLFTVTTSGESHGPGLSAIVDGCPPGLEIDESDIQKELNKRRPGQSRFTSQRKEKDEVTIMSGVFEGVTTGTPIILLFRMWIRKQKTTVPSKINLDRDMLTIPIFINTVSEITEEEEDLLLVKPL